MKIEQIKIENFRCFKDETIRFDDYTCFVGANGAGKSTVFNALNIFFRQYKDSKTDLSKLSKDDFHHKDTSKPIRITVTFTELSEAAKEELSDYVRQDKLIVTAVATYDEATERAEVKQFGNRLGFESFRVFFEGDKAGLKVNDLQNIYSDLQAKHADLKSATTKTAMISNLQTYEAERPQDCVTIQSEDQFYGITKGANKLSSYIQWVFIPASKDATEESEESKTSALGQLLARTVRSKISFDEKMTLLRANTRASYQELLDKEQSALDGISKSLQSRLTSWAHPNISAQVLWKQDSEKSIKIEEPWAYIKIGERGFESDLTRFGHGLQRSYMLALLQELTMQEDEDAPTLIMGVEEPELYQHPPQARYLAETLIDLSEKGSQVIVCTHSPLFIPSDNFDKIRIVREVDTPSHTKIKSVTYEVLAKELEQVGEKLYKDSAMIAKLYSSLNPITNEMFFCKVLILVEGYEDLAFLTSYLMLTHKIIDFRKYGCHIVQVGGKDKLIKPLAIAKLLGIPTFVIYDGDTNKIKDFEITQHKKENKAILVLQGHEDKSEWPNQNIITENLICWKTNLSETIQNEFESRWNKYRDKANAFYGNAGDLHKNPLLIAKVLELASEDNFKSNILTDTINKIIAFAKSSSPDPIEVNTKAVSLN